MAKKIEITEELKKLRTAVQEKKLVVGTDKVLKELKAGKVEKIYLAENCPPKIREDINHYAKMANVPILELNQSNEELGIFCKKNFFVSVVGVK